jgi:hypothetical protein
MVNFHFHRISDAVYGTFGITELETDIISTKIFQRLHNVQQLGLAYLVYPDLNYSRFAHSLGACHVAGRMMRAINANSSRNFDNDEIQLYRLAALLHDIGHYPFSHAVEHVVQDHYKEKAFLADANSPAENESEQPAALGHELLGRHIFDLDPEIHKVLEKHKMSPADVKAVFSREQPGKLVSLVSSDLDCDRLDYLKRTATHGGLPFGVVDADYIIGQSTLDADERFCLTDKALRAADHLLVSRYFDYTQVVFHKTVVALEKVLMKVVAELLSRGLMDFSAAAIDEKIANGDFALIDDAYLVGKLRQLDATIRDADDPLKIKLQCVLHRIPPKLVAGSERITSHEGIKEHKNRVRQIREKVDLWAQRFSIPRELWHVWHTSLPLTKIGSHVPLSTAMEGEFEDGAEEAVRILVPNRDGSPARSRPLVEFDHALTKQLSTSRLYAIRVYVHLVGADARQRRAAIEAQIRADLPEFDFTK